MGVRNKKSQKNLSDHGVGMLQRNVHRDEWGLVDEFIKSLPLTAQAMQRAKEHVRGVDREPAS